MGEQNATQEQGTVNPDQLVLADVRMANKRLEGYITLQPVAAGNRLTVQYLLEVLAKFKVTVGIDKNALQTLVQNPVYKDAVLVARGVDSTPDTNASLKYHFQLQRDISPKVKEDGTVDFKDLGIVQLVKKDDLLVEKIPRVPGKPGVDVCGIAIPPRTGKDLFIPAGRNVRLTTDKLQLYAAADGQVVYVNDRVSVFNTFTVDGDVSLATGNIDFTGNVLVKGNIQSGYTVNATGNIQVKGVVESASVTAGGDIIIGDGFTGGATGELRAGGSITTKFIQGGKVTCTGNLETTYIYNATIRCGDTINVITKGLVVGGHIIARTRINAGMLGNDNGTATIVEVGSDPDALKRYYEIPTEVENCNKNIKAIESAVDLLGQLKALGRLTPDKEEQLVKSQTMLTQLNETLVMLGTELDLINEKVANFGKGYLAVRHTAFPGVKIIMGQEQMLLKSKYQFTLFSRNEGRITAGLL